MLLRLAAAVLSDLEALQAEAAQEGSGLNNFDFSVNISGSQPWTSSIDIDSENTPYTDWGSPAYNAAKRAAFNAWCRMMITI